MTPKDLNDGVKDAGKDVIALCLLIMSCDDFKADYNKLMVPLGFAQARNVPRKINTIINPHGFELKNGKVMAKGGGNGSEGPATPKATSKQTGSATPKTPGSKKRKINADEGDNTVNDG